MEEGPSMAASSSIAISEFMVGSIKGSTVAATTEVSIEDVGSFATTGVTAGVMAGAVKRDSLRNANCGRCNVNCLLSRADIISGLSPKRFRTTTGGAITDSSDDFRSSQLPCDNWTEELASFSVLSSSIASGAAPTASFSLCLLNVPSKAAFICKSRISFAANRSSSNLVWSASFSRRIFSSFSLSANSFFPQISSNSNSFRRRSSCF
mmetsp:Transcript_33893/g.46464  ORF Transcript_33893/g.46464 Transcript_33893/m.46464 type:complete len:208 (-) Transcript_33893:784-1407(-)